MMYLLRESIAGVAAGIKCRPYLDYRLTRRMVKLVTARSLGNCMASDFPVGNPEMDDTGRQKEIHVPLLFTEMNTHKNSVPVGNPKIDNSGGRRKKQIDFPDFFKKIKAQMKTNPKKRVYGPMDHHEKKFYGPDHHEKKTFYGPVFTGEVEKRYLEYLDMLDWKSFHRHVKDYPRRRSENEKRLIFEKWASHNGRKYPSPDIQEMRFTSFKKGLAFIDESNSKHESFRLGLGSKHLDRRDETVFVDKCDGNVYEFPKMDDIGCQKKIYFPLFFTKMKSQQQKTDHHKKILYGPVFTGEVEKRYLEYLKKLDWDSLHKHVIDYPRRRSDEEKMLIFDKWAAHYGKKYLPEDYYEFEENCHDSVDLEFEFEDLAYDAFEERLEYIDNVNSKHKEGLTLGLDSDADKKTKKKTDITGDSKTYRVEGFSIPYHSITPPLYCELTGTPDTLDYDCGFQVCFPL